MSPVPSVELTVYPDECDTYGHVNQAAFVRLFERARWDVLAAGPGMEPFRRLDAWPAVRKSTVEYYAGAFPGDRLRFDTTLTHLGQTSFTLHQTARRDADRILVAEADFVFVCIDRDGRPTAVPEAISRYFGTRPSVRSAGTQHVTVRGVTMAFDAQGDGPTILFIHGFPLDRTVWRHQMMALAGWRRVAPDLRGLGLSEAPTAAAYSMAEYADDLIALLDHLEIDQVVACGLSMGGYIVFELLRRYRNRIRGLVLASTRAEADSAEGRAGRDAAMALVQQRGLDALAEQMIPKLLGPSSLAAMPRVVETVRTMITACPSAGVVGAIGAMRARIDSTPLLGGIDVPTLILAGKNDLLIPSEAAEAMAAVIPGARLSIIEEAGHLAPLEQPIAASRALTEFLDTVR